jgi:hypothetical protein
LLAQNSAPHQKTTTKPQIGDGCGLAVDTLSVSQWDFFFVLAALIGMISLALLARVREEGEVEEGVVLDEVYVGVRRFFRNLGTVAGLRQGTDLALTDEKESDHETPKRDEET